MAAAAAIAATTAAVMAVSVLLVRTYAGVSVAVSEASQVRRLRARLGRARRRGAAVVGVLLAWLVVLIATGWATGLVVDLTTEGGSVGLVRWFAARRMTWLTDILQGVTWLGDSTVVFPLAVVAGLCWRWRRGDWWALTLLGVGYVGSGAMFNAVKFLVARARPGADFAIGSGAGGAYPSGHTANATVLFVGLLVVVFATAWGRRRDGRLAALAGGVIAVVGLSRIYLGVHWLTDVIGGALLAGLWIGGVVGVLGAPPTDALTGSPSERRGSGTA